MNGLVLIFLWPIFAALIGIGIYCFGIILKAVGDMFGD
jgi:hypothetical protein